MSCGSCSTSWSATVGEALLAGGPRDGARITVGETSAITAVYAKRIRVLFHPPRPAWWRHPVQWFRWRPPPPPPPPELIQLTYRDTGKTDNGARVFQLAGDWPWFKGPEAGDDENLYKALMVAFAAVDPVLRHDPETRWVMDLDWYKRVRAMMMVPIGNDDEDPGKWVPSPQDMLLAIPVTVTDDGGAPHIENRRYPADY
jgi:hypothetical protein